LHLGNISKGIYLRCTDPWTSNFYLVGYFEWWNM